ncbi:hypothetical protein SCWH03_11710 [Streptomyces pacificus]|uniref:Uncharacterized protein n=1 Tax=Streptomyces pacificus TaxID=2705029 RepID=A0A6A0ATL9_9ACTN|nr:hypothetical protein SCWH03_11710 [Streptomyces pacificus]
MGGQRRCEPGGRSRRAVPAGAEEAVFDLTADAVAAPDGATGFREGPASSRGTRIGP